MSLVSELPSSRKKKFSRLFKKKWFWILLFLLLFLFGAGGFLYKTGYILNKISEKNNSVLGSLWGVLPMGEDEAEGFDEDGRKNILLVGMRGANIPGGGLLADTIMVISLKKDENKVALISIPRDLYVKVPNADWKAKINAVYAHGEENGKGKGLEEMKQIVTEITGLNIHHAVSINFTGFRQLIDAIGGIDITLETAFYETSQFVQGQECGGEFILPKGENHLDGETTLCYVRARENTSDFDRAKRQQIILKALKEKLVSIGTLADFNKVNGILNAIGDNVRTDMSSREMVKFYEEYSFMTNAEIYQRVFENSEEGLLTVPEDAPESAGYILIPRAGYDNYGAIQEVCINIFTLAPQSDITPVKQYYKPQPKEEEKNEKKKDKDKEDEKDKN